MKLMFYPFDIFKDNDINKKEKILILIKYYKKILKILLKYYFRILIGYINNLKDGIKRFVSFLLDNDIAEE